MGSGLLIEDIGGMHIDDTVDEGKTVESAAAVKAVTDSAATTTATNTTIATNSPVTATTNDNDDDSAGAGNLPTTNPYNLSVAEVGVQAVICDVVALDRAACRAAVRGAIKAHRVLATEQEEISDQPGGGAETVLAAQAARRGEIRRGFEMVAGDGRLRWGRLLEQWEMYVRARRMKALADDSLDLAVPPAAVRSFHKFMMDQVRGGGGM